MAKVVETKKFEISKKLQKVVKLIQKMEGDVDFTTLSDDEIIHYNKHYLSKSRVANRLLKKFPKHVETSTYIIPVDDGVVTGYFFQQAGVERRRLTSLRPLIIYYHGGGWIFGNMGLYKHVCARLVQITGADVLAVDYRLAPHHKFPTAVEDSYNTLLWAAQGARYWKIDPEQIYVAGDSAGGNLATVVARLARDRKGPQLAGQILLYPITDGRLKTPSFTTFKDTPMLTEKQMQFYVNHYQREPKDILNTNFSPLLAKDHSRLPPTLIITSEFDPLLDDGKFYAQELKSADTPVQYLEVKGALHGFFPYPDATGTDLSEGAIIQFIEGKPLNQIELITKANLKKKVKLELKESKRNNKIVVEVE
ncbi:MAG: alpha/beta hydrolase [Sphaerochaetaceae bacterium]